MTKLQRHHLQAVGDFVDAIPLKSWTAFVTLAEYARLAEFIVDLHASLSHFDAKQLIYEEVIAAASAHKPSDGCDLPLEFRALARERLIKQIDSLPRRYTLSIELKNFPDLGDFAGDIGPSLRIVRPSGRRVDPMTLLVAAVTSGARPPTKQPQTCLEISFEGYARDRGETTSTAAAVSKAKQCVVLLSVHGVLHRRFGADLASALLTDETDQATTLFKLEDAVCRCFGDFELNETKWQVYDPAPDTTLLGAGYRPARTPEEKRDAFINEARSALALMTLDQQESDVRALVSALEWAHDSIYTENQTLAYLAACIGMEALLGEGQDGKESNLDQMSKRLADRYAYLMGNGRSDRKRLSAEYDEVRILRGRLVHGRKARLTVGEQATLHKAQTMLLNVIWKELRQMRGERQIAGLLA